jgi:ADP-ribose pyrophosphatase YjhB (NUDIX family)
MTNEYIICPKCGEKIQKYRNPIPTVDIIIEIRENEVFKGIVLIYRKNVPQKWAIPGGFVDYGESLEASAIREAKEETGLDVKNMRQFKAYSKPNRDPRRHTISNVFIGEGYGNVVAGDDAEEIGIFTEKTLPENLAFDHKDILKDYFDFKRDG